MGGAVVRRGHGQRKKKSEEHGKGEHRHTYTKMKTKNPHQTPTSGTEESIPTHVTAELHQERRSVKTLHG